MQSIADLEMVNMIIRNNVRHEIVRTNVINISLQG